jgi:hypothetical protein
MALMSSCSVENGRLTPLVLILANAGWALSATVWADEKADQVSALELSGKK